MVSSDWEQKYVLSTSEIDSAPEQTLKGYYSLCSWFIWYLILLWLAVFVILIAAFVTGITDEDDEYWSKLTKEENKDFYYACIVFSAIIGVFWWYTVLSNNEIEDDYKKEYGVIKSGLNVVKDVSAIYQNKYSTGIMHRGIANLFSKQNTSVKDLEDHFRNTKVGKIFKEF